MMQVTGFGLVPNEGSEAQAWEEVAVISGGRLLTVEFCILVAAPVVFGVLMLGDFMVLSLMFTFSSKNVLISQ